MPTEHISVRIDCSAVHCDFSFVRFRNILTYLLFALSYLPTELTVQLKRSFYLQVNSSDDGLLRSRQQLDLMCGWRSLLHSWRS